MTTERYIHGISETTSVAYGNLVRLVKVTGVNVMDAFRLRVYFDRNMKKNDDLIDTTYYHVYPISSGAVTPYISEIQAPDVINPSYVDLITSEMTGNSTYEAIVYPNGPVDINDLDVDENYNAQSFVAVGINPTIKQIIAISETRVDVVFSENMKYNEAIKTPDKYTFDNGLTVLNVLEVVGDTVKLATTEQLPGVLYTLTLGL